MANILITDVRNRNCPCCFARGNARVPCRMFCRGRRCNCLAQA